MSIRKREWENASGAHEAWQIAYTDATGKRRTETFASQKEAKDRHAEITVEIKKGSHTPKSTSITIAEAGDLWIKTAEGNQLERSTLVDYKRTLRMHIVPYIGERRKLSQLSAPMVRTFEDNLRADGRSPAMVRRTRTALSMLLADAMERGLVNRNVARELKRGKERQADRRAKGKLKVGVDIPTPDEIRAIVGVLKGRWRALLLTATFCGLRGSELRGLRWDPDVDFAKSELHVCQRADRYNVIGRPKSEAGERTVPIPPPVLLALKEWRLACPRGPLGLAFPNTRGLSSPMATSSHEAGNPSR
jgi:integrase